MRGDLVIGIDSSTTATKAIAFDARGRIVAEGRAPIPLSNPHPGWFEQEVSDWTGALTKALKQLTKKIDAKRIAGLAISNQRESFAQFDAAAQIPADQIRGDWRGTGECTLDVLQTQKNADIA